MILQQDNKCAICNKKLIKPYIDHEHKTGKIRNILCRNCNSILGYSFENINILRQAIKYLKKHEVKL